MISTAERAVQEQATRDFIAADPEQLEIWRTSPTVSDGAGGKVEGTAFVVAPDQVCRLLPQSRNSTQVTSQTAAGNLDSPRFVVMTTSEFAFEHGDFFIWKGFEWLVDSVHEVPEYESKADVHRGRKVTDG
jgi:hypothetical protein